MTRRRKVKRPAPLGGTTFHVRDQDGGDLVAPAPVAGIAILKAQQAAQDIPEPATYYVERQTLFGPPVDLYEVKRDPDGNVLTYTLSHED